MFASLPNHAAVQWRGEPRPTSLRFRKTIMNKFFRAVVFFVLAWASLSNPAWAAEPTVIQRIFVNRENDRTPGVEPKVVSSTGGGSFIVAGSSGFMGWAAKFDAQGKTLWTYRGKKEPYKPGGHPPPDPDFRGVAAMPDGTTYLCSNFYNSWPSNSPTALLTHLDANGQLMSEKFFWPDNKKIQITISWATFAGCTAWKDGFVVLGQILEKTGAFTSAQSYYWVIKFDSTGKVEWEQYIPFQFGNGKIRSSFFSGALRLVVTENRLFFSVKSLYAPLETGIVGLTDTGELKGKLNIPGGDFFLVRPYASRNQIQLSGSMEANKNAFERAIYLITFNQDLQEQRRVKTSTGFRSGIIFERRNGTLVAFGTDYDESGHRGDSQILQTDQNLSRNKITKEPTDAGISDSGGTRTIAWYDGDDKFIRARFVAKDKPGILGLPQKNDIPDDFVMGMLIEIIQLK